MKTWNRERKRTRDRLLQYDFSIIPAHPHSAGLPMIYPWENLMFNELQNALLQLAKKHGYTGDDNAFYDKFFNVSSIMRSPFANFPIPGQEDSLYLDEDTDILYYFKQTSNTIDIQTAASNGIVIVGNKVDQNTNETITYMYIPVRALPIEDLILNSGTAAEYID